LCKFFYKTRTELRILGFDITFRGGDKSQSARSNDLRASDGAITGPSGWGNLYDSIFTGSGTVTRQKALQVPSVFAAVDVVSRTLASLPFKPMRSTEKGAEEAKGHPLWAIETIEPSPMITAFNFRRDMFADACFGNAFAKITFKGNGRAAKLERLVPEDVFIYQSENGALYYMVARRDGKSTNTEILRQDEVIHLRGMTLDGWQGMDIPTAFSSSLAMSIEATRYGHNFFTNNAGVDKVVEYPGSLSTAERERLEGKIRQKHSGVSNVGGTIVLDAGMKMTSIGLNPQEAMLNDTRMFQAYESCRIFGVPAHMINVLDRSTFNNIEMMDNGFVKYCLTPWAQQWEAEHDVKLLTTDEKLSGSVFHRFDLSGLMRGDMKSRGEYEDKMLKNMVYTINDVRRLNDLNAVPWGNLPYAQAGVTPVNEDGTIDINTPADGPEEPKEDPKAQPKTDNEPEPE